MKFILFSIFILKSVALFAGEATDYIDRGEKQLLGKSFQSLMTMKVIRGEKERVLKMRIWLEDQKKAVVKIVHPAKDLGTGNLRLELNLWQYLPNVERLVKIPPSMMLQSWMGSDFTNDDIVKTSSLLNDYTHTVEKKLKIDGEEVIQIVCLPKPTAPVVWGKVVEYLRVKDAALIKREFYTEKNELVRVLVGEKIQVVDGHAIPTVMTMSSPKKEGAKTIIIYEDIKFDQKIESSVFTQEFLRKPVKN